MEENGYPTEETLDKIRNWDFQDFEGLAKFCHNLWYYPSYSSFNGEEWEVSTGGWSGHEDIIDELPRIWKALFHYSWRVGGHYVFKKNVTR
jgi:hypothetical protein